MLDSPLEFLRETHRAMLPSLFEHFSQPHLLVFVCRDAERIEGQVRTLNFVL